MRKLLLVVTITCILIISSSALDATGSSIQWTEQEIEFMDNNPVIRLGVDPAFVPFEFIDADGEYKGITAEYIQLVQERTGLVIEVVSGLTWTEAYDKALAGDIDVLPAVAKTSEREQHFLFSNRYYNFKRVIVTMDTNNYIKGIHDLEGLMVAVQRNSSHHSYLLSYPGINLSLYDSVEEALTSVADGTEIAFVGNLATTNYLIRSTALTNLKFTAFDTEQQQGLYFAVRKDWPELIGILNKALATITEAERIAIHNKWIGLETEIDYSPIIRIIAGVGFFILLIWLVSVYWIYQLRKEIIKRKAIQVELEQAKREAEIANDFKSNFMARMSHEIRTPLNAITGMAYLLKKTNVSLTQKMYIERIRQASNTMLGIINDILDFSKIEAGKVDLEIVSFNLDEVIKDVIAIVSYKIEEQGIGLRVTKDPNVPTWLYGDQKRIEQILLNILNNAAKFTSNGEVSLDVRLMAKESNIHHLSFSIKDTGIGMSEAQVKQLFLPFSQADSSINRRFGGTGLGLSIVKSFVDMMGGQVQVYSTEGEGSTFIVQLSLEIDSKKESEFIEEIASGYFANIRTLVLEKTGANMNVIDSYLSAFGMGCELTSSQVSAISMLENANKKYAEPFDLLILDYDTPDEKGFAFIKGVRENKKIKKTPKIMLLLPMNREDLLDNLEQYGVDIGIVKPIIPSILFNGILELFQLSAIATNQELGVWNEGFCSPENNPYGILVVEDNKTNQLIVESVLKQTGFRVWLANNGVEGVSVYKKHKQSIDLILMDLHMPEMNGYDASLQIREESVEVPIVAMTADVVQGVKEKCEEHGIGHYISKPFNPERLIQVITEILNIAKRESKSTSSQNLESDSNILNESIGLQHIGNNQQLYEKVLQEYYNENQQTIYKLSSAIGSKRYDEAIQIVHKLKSSTGSIGAIELHKVTIDLQKALKENKDEEIAALFAGFRISMEKLLMRIRENHM
ncbi:response regulator [Desulfuribacillus alkaliarsenatis]|uniref:Circadian input-output histidine kinase CikA n=1 Tax=Desulfuribacillus alkaliarsenatis TaxID=766136 RepID=A0A1E5G2R4_9FIRM|nr:transporter substrate-binding domain-containing protein [Desulfuribacillus alkaliarsenatis]OEF97173.1 histidine kinase [Desulfuribacillus alkaliarsenatis]